MERRRLERTLRVDVLALCRWASRRGLTLEAAADILGMCAGTIRTWQQRWREDRLAIEPRGRPLDRAETYVRNLVLAVLGLCGPGVSIACLSELFPLVARRELEHLAQRYRRVWRKRGILLHVLHWKREAAVWAIDFTEPPAPVDSAYPFILSVRDLATGKQLCALPAREASSAVTCAALRSLFVEHGPPLVLKSDNGSHFTSTDVVALLRAHHVLHLRSPAGTPEYNGACEAGIGGLKTRAHHEAARHGRPGHWTCDDVEAARLLGNAAARPRGPDGPTPDDAWCERHPLVDYERQLLHRVVERSRTEERDRVYADRSTEPPAHIAASIERVAICRAMLELNILQLRRRRFTLPIRRPRVGNIS